MCVGWRMIVGESRWVDEEAHAFLSGSVEIFDI